MKKARGNSIVMKGHFKKRGCICEPKHCTCNNTWSFVIDVGKDPKTGKRKQVTKGGFKTKTEAEAAASALITEVHSGTFVKESDILFKDWVTEWLHHYIERTCPKPGTIRLRQYSVNKLLPYFAHLKLKSITDAMYQAALNDLKKQGFTRSTLEGIHTTGKMIFQMATKKKMLKVNPTEDAYIKKDEKTLINPDEEDDEGLPVFFEKEELATFLNTARDKGLYMDEAIFITLAYTGMRVGELVALQWKDIDFNKKIIRITKTYYNEKNKTTDYQLVSPKTKKSKRRIIVDEMVIDVLKKHKEKQEQIISRLGKNYNNNGYVFAGICRYPGFPILIKFVGTRMARLLEKTKLNPDLTPHSLRHTHTSLLAEAGVDIEEIMERLGHEDENTTRKIYLHVTNEMKKEASDKFSKLMSGLT